jgi:hypothetical protein
MPDKWNKRRVFLEQLGKALVTPHIQRRERLPCTAASAALVKAIQGLNLVLIHLRLYLGQARGGDANSAPPKKDCKMLCAAHVRNTSAKSMHSFFKKTCRKGSFCSLQIQNQFKKTYSII